MAPVSTEELLRRRLEQTLRQETALLAMASAVDQPFTERLRHILRTEAHTLEIARVSFWSLRSSPLAIQCDLLYLADRDAFEPGPSLAADDFPRYFEAMQTGRPIAAHDAHADPRTSEFSAGYLTAHGIGAMLDVPVFLRGQLVGVVCHEHVGPARRWTADEELFATATGQLVQLALESRRREEAERALRESEARFRTIVEAAPVAMLVTSFPEGVVLYCNRALAALAGTTPERMVSQQTPELFARPDELRPLLREIQKSGRVAGVEVELRRADGSLYWALLSAERFRYGDRSALIAGVWDLSMQKQMEEQLRHMALHVEGPSPNVLRFDRKDLERVGTGLQSPGYAASPCRISLHFSHAIPKLEIEWVE